MSEAIGQSLPFAVGAAISPIPIIAVVLILTTPRARTNGPAFLLGWLAGIAGVGAIVLAVASGADAGEQDAPADWLSALRLLLALLLLVLAVRIWRGRPRNGTDISQPAWMDAVDQFTAPRAAGLGLVCAINPKNLLLTVGGAAAIAQTDVSSSTQAAALAVFVAVCSAGVCAPLALHVALGERAADTLDELKGRLSRNNAAIMTVILLVLAAKLAGDALSGFSG